MIRFMAGHPTAANLMMIGFLVLGAFSIPSLQRETFPRLEPSEIEISVAYPGARAEDVEQAICRRIEDAMDAVNNLVSVECEARESLARATVEKSEGASLDRVTAEVKSEIDAITDFPENAEDPVVTQLGLTDFVAALAVTGPESQTDLKAYAEGLKDRMLLWGGITKVEISGFSDHQIRIELDETALRQFGLSVLDVANAIARQSVDLPAGSLKTSQSELLVRFADERKRPLEFEDIVVAAAASGGQVRLREIATITDQFELDEEQILFDGKPAAILQIYKTADEDSLEAIGAVNGFLEHERKTAPPGIELQITNDASSIVRDRLNLLTTNGMQGLVLVFLTMWLFFGFRYSFWVAMGLPVSFAGAFAVMVMIGYSINMLTMVGLLIAIGLLMDDAIVISENIAAHKQRGKTALQAAVDGVRQVAPSVFASFATTAFIFGSLMFLKGDIGQILGVIPVVMLVVLTVSLIEAFLILPNHLNHALHQGGIGEGRVQQRVEAWLAAFRDGPVARLVSTAIAWRYLTVGSAFAVLLLAIALPAGGLLKFVVFPELDGDTVEARILLPQGTPLWRTEQVVGKVEAALRRVDERLTPEQPDGQKLVRHVTLRFNKNQDAFETGAHVATVTVDLLSAEVRNATSDEILSAWREETGDLPDVLNLKFAETQLGPGGLPIDIRLKGSDLDRLKAASLELQDWLRNYRGVHDLTDDLRPGKPEFGVRLKDGASTLGLNGRMIADQLRTAFFGNTISEIQSGYDVVEIDVRLAAANRDKIADLEDFMIVAGDGASIPLTAVADIVPGRGYARINRVDGQLAVTIQGEVDTRIANASAIVRDTLERFMPTLLERYPDVRLALEGQNKEAADSASSMVRGFIIGLIGVYLLLSFQFRSYLEPVVVMVAIPLALVGVLVGHVLMGLDMSMPSMLGFVSLAGVVVNNSILLVNFIKERHEAGESVMMAAEQASRSRFRAIFLTSATTLAGLLPILSETSLQAQVLIPLVTSLVFGLIASTILVILVIPALYTVLDDLGFSTLEEREDEVVAATAD
jgi:multidrug efflux pump subunit AcrB